MTTVRYLAEDELIRRAIEILMANLGPVETALCPNHDEWNRCDGIGSG